MAFTVTLRDHSVERVDDADAYTPERSLTTFFRTANARGAVDCWSVALASFRTDEILVIRRCGETGPASAAGDRSRDLGVRARCP
ncbi:MAG TPA: hypothetical protein VJM33_02190 [Microthrixaceae bacterium]|nr:hypothetical protein [Microthrixaceae bacterium]